MKRVPLNRYTPKSIAFANKRSQLKPGGPLERKSRMKQMSKHKAKEIRETRPLHKAWLAQFVRCWECGRPVKLTIQHMSKQSHGGDCHHLCNLFAACAECNCGVLDHSDSGSFERQLAKKFFWDRESFDYEYWLKIHGSNPITVGNVIDEVLKLLGSH